MIIASFMILFMALHTRIAKNAAQTRNVQLAGQANTIMPC